MSRAVAERALSFWGLEGCVPELVAQRENRVYRVAGPDNVTYALRLHRPGYRSDAELSSELAWLAALHEGGLPVPLPVALTSGALLHRLDGMPVSLLSWLSGIPMGESGRGLDIADRPAAFRAVGNAMAHLHRISDEWQRPAGFERCNWDFDGLLGREPLWGRFWENPQLSAPQRDLVVAARDKARGHLKSVEQKLDFGLIHADLVRENVLFCGDTPQLIDFDDGGFGFRLFDVATTLNKNRKEPDYPALQAAFVEGYRQVRPLDMAELSFFMALRAFTYLGWIMTRMDEPGAPVRCTRFIENAVELSHDYLAPTEAR
ncbi:phosphotransferase enzyme family protein [Hoeflea sp. TYP-13]|uniref:phosphotransferase enzyme family protein n=1 Tax=Hoeflea sp. TYP-13 TaxID=3230023 RepID=UPI0034C5C9EA